MIGTSIGSVRFYDFRFRIVCWFENIGLGRVTSINFSKKTFDYDFFWQKHAETSDLKENYEYNFDYVDFVVCDSNAKIHRIDCSLFSEIESAARRGELLVEGLRKSVVALAAEPTGPHAILSCRNGAVYKWRIGTTYLDKMKEFSDDKEWVSCMAFSSEGRYLAAGTSQGSIYVKKNDQEGFDSAPLMVSHKKKSFCEKLVFSPDGQYFAVKDDLHCVTLFRLGHKYDDPALPIEWVFSGKVQSHTAKIRDIVFAKKTTYPEEMKRSNLIGNKVLYMGYSVIWVKPKIQI